MPDGGSKFLSSMRRFLRALQFLTVLPVPRLQKEDGAPAALASSALFFPLVGVLIGVLSYGVFWLASVGLPPRLSVLVLVFGPILLSGALHVDGLSDFCDGFFSARSDRDQVLKIMKDSRIGVMGALGVILVVLAKYELLVHLGARPWFFFFATAASRTMQVLLAFYQPYVGGPLGMGKDFVGCLARQDVAAAVWITVLLGLPLGFSVLFFEVLFLALLACLLGFWTNRKIGGVTGDVLGAGGEFSEVCVLTVAAWMTRS